MVEGGAGGRNAYMAPEREMFDMSSCDGYAAGGGELVCLQEAHLILLHAEDGAAADDASDADGAREDGRRRGGRKGESRLFDDYRVLVRQREVVQCEREVLGGRKAAQA